jgi:hypothetical protein
MEKVARVTRSSVGRKPAFAVCAEPDHNSHWLWLEAQEPNCRAPAAQPTEVPDRCAQQNGCGAQPKDAIRVLPPLYQLKNKEQGTGSLSTSSVPRKKYMVKVMLHLWWVSMLAPQGGLPDDDHHREHRKHNRCAMRSGTQCSSTGLVEADLFASLAPRASPWSSEEVPLCGSYVQGPTPRVRGQPQASRTWR